MEQRNSSEQVEYTPTAAEQPEIVTKTATQAASRGLDSMPFEKSDLAKLTPDQRSALYLNQIRKMMIFFVVLAAVGIIAGIIIGIVDINAVHAAQQTPTLGY